VPNAPARKFCLSALPPRSRGPALEGNFFAPGGQDFEFRPKAGLQAIAALNHFSNFFLYNNVMERGFRPNWAIFLLLGNFFAPGDQEPELKFMILTWEGMFVACYRMK
jgi:hypothetical protein